MSVKISSPRAFYTDSDLDDLGLASRMTRWRLRQKNQFPEPIKLSPGRVAYDADDIHAWIAERKSNGSQ